MAISIKARGVDLFAMFLALTATPGLSVASDSCASNLHEETMRDGAQLYVASSTYEGLSVHQALDGVRIMATADGYLIATKPDYGSSSPSLGIGKPPSPAPTLIQIQPPAGISFTTIVPSGVHVDAQDVRKRLCALVDKFDSGRPPVAGQHQPVETAVEKLEKSRTTIAVTKPSVNLLKPSVPFDLNAAKASLEPGRSIIRGQVCGAWRGNLVLGTRPVLLYPASAYLEQLVTLAKKAKPGKDQVLTDPDMVFARMEAKPNENGEFQFSKMKPGRYFLMTSISAILGGSRDVYAGHVTTGYGSANVYTTQNFSYGSDGEITRFVEVRKDGDKVKVTMQPSISINPLTAQRGLGGSIFGCSKLGMKVSHGE